MNKILQNILGGLLTVLSPAVAFGQISNGYYRVEGIAAGQSLYIKSGVAQEPDYAQGSIDLGNLRGVLVDNDKYSMPSTVVYISKISTEFDGSLKVNLSAQGISTTQIVGAGANLYLEPTSSNDTYYAFASLSKGGMSFIKYLQVIDVDDDFEGFVDAVVQAGEKDAQYSKLKITPLDESSNYFGINPRVELDGAYYDPFYVDFPYTFSSSGMTAYCVKGLSEVGSDGKAYAIYGEAGISNIPAGTPLIIKCSSSDPASNKLKINGVSGESLTSTNILNGAYRCCPSPAKIRDVVTYDPSTMRVLGTEDGKLVFKKSNQSYIGANEAYIQVPSNYPDVLQVVTQSEYEDILASGIYGVSIEKANVNPRTKGIYSISGVRVAETKDFDKLPSGVYIVDGKQQMK